MRFYEDRLLPYLVHFSMRQRSFAAYRRRLVPAATGTVLEVGIGSGLNLPFYSEAAIHVLGIDPSHRLLGMSKRSASAARGSIHLLEGSAEVLPLRDNTVDTVVTTWTLCSIPDVANALKAMHRVLKPEGQLLFVEHGRSPDANVRRWQDRLTPIWKHVAGGCHLNRPIRDLIERSGFVIEQLETGYMEGPKAMTFMYEGRARRV